MNRSGDHPDDMDTYGQQQELDDRTVDRLLAGQLAGPGDLREIVELIRLTSALPPPAPNPALAEVLRIGLHPGPAPGRQTPHVGWPMRTGLIAAALFAATFGAATANALPAPVQAIVDDIRARNPFEPSPAERQQDVPSTSTPTPPQVPEPAAVPAPATQRQEEGAVLPPLSGRSGEAPDARTDDDDEAAEPERRDDRSGQVTDDRDEATDDTETGTDPENSPTTSDDDDVEDVEGAAEVDRDDPTELTESTSDPED